MYGVDPCVKAHHIIRRRTFYQRCLRTEGTTGSAGATPSARAQRSERRALAAHERCSTKAGTNHSARTGWPKRALRGNEVVRGNEVESATFRSGSRKARQGPSGRGSALEPKGSCAQVGGRLEPQAARRALPLSGQQGCRSHAACMYTCCEAVEQPPACLNAVLTQHASELRGGAGSQAPGAQGDHFGGRLWGGAGGGSMGDTRCRRAGTAVEGTKTGGHKIRGH